MIDRVLVTGASGFVGGHIVPVLQSRGITVRCLVRPSSRLDYLKPHAPELVLGDVTDPKGLDAALAGVDAVVHCAGITKAASRSEFFRVNLEGTRNLYSACAEQEGKIYKIVHVGSLAALGPSEADVPVTEDSPPRPVSDYGESKLAAQRAAQSWMRDLPICIIMPPAVYGPRDPDFLIYFRLVRRSIFPLLGREVRRLSLIYVRDLAEAVAEALVQERSIGRSYLVEDGAVQTWTGMAAAIGKAMARNPRPLRIPVAAVRGLGALGDLYIKVTGKTAITSSQKIREFLQPAWTCSSQRIRDDLGFRPRYSLDEGIRETLAWYEEKHWL
jgi:nucleoside-diphosphate-sugar epimerase